MKKLHDLVLILTLMLIILSCKKDDPNPSFTTDEPDFCRLTRAQDPYTSTVYTYNSAGQVYQEKSFSSGILQWYKTFFYNANEVVEKVVYYDKENVESGYSEWLYSSGGKIAEVRWYSSSTSQIPYYRDVYAWSENNCMINQFKPGSSLPSNTMEYEFSGENIVHIVSQLDRYDHGSVRGTTLVIDAVYSEFDSKISVPYFLNSRQPGYSIISKNNLGLVITKSYRKYLWGIENLQETVKNFTYTYNSQNITTSKTDKMSDLVTEYNYESCN